MPSLVKVFIASPGDLPEERKLVRARADQFNRLWGEEYDLFVKVVGWEDVPPAAKRAQERLNMDADECHIFIGMLAERWGSDSGLYSSGFEEEFYGAQKRRRLTDTPEIALFFRAVESRRAADAGPQLSKVLQFREAIEQGKELYFREFSSPTELGDLIDGVFSEYARARRQMESSQGDAISRSATPASAIPDDTLTADSNSIDAVIAVTHAANAEVAADKLDFWSRVRLSLYSTAIRAWIQEHVSIHVHDVNLVYRKRKQWRLVAQEESALIREMLSDSSKYNPGWYWLAEGGVERARSRLWVFCIHDGRTKKAAAELLARDSQLPADIVLVRDALKDSTTAVSICRLIERAGSVEDIPLLREAEATVDPSGAIVPALARAEFALTLKGGTPLDTSALLDFAERGVPSAAEFLGLKLSEADDTEIRGMLARLKGDVRLRLASGLQSQGKLSTELSKELLGDSSAQVRAVAVRALISYGRFFSRKELSEIFPRQDETGSVSLLSLVDLVNPDPLIYESLKLRKFEELLSSIDFFSLDGSLVVAALGELYWPATADKLAGYLANDFEDLRAECDARYLAEHGVKLSLLYEKSGDNSLIEYLRSRLIEAALRAVYRGGHPRAVELARKFWDPRYAANVRAAALDVLQRDDTELDYESVASAYAKLSLSAPSRVALEVVSRLSLTPDNLQLMVTDATHAGREALEEVIIRAWKDEFTQTFVGLLTSDNEPTRLLAARVLSKALDHEHLEKLLDEYIERATYFYDVTVILDREVYAANMFKA